MTPFLKQVAVAFRDDISTDPKSLCFVFPNKRAAVFFRQYLSEQCDKPVFSPKLMTMNELFCGLSPFRQPDRISLLQKLYRCYVDITSSKETFDEFVYWGDMILADFNDVDKYLVNASQLFSNISDLNAIKDDFSYMSPSQIQAVESFWNGYFPLSKGKHSAKAKFASDWNMLYPLYCRFNEMLRAQGEAYEGMIYRMVAENTGALKESLDALGKIVFVGLNALNECEKRLLSLLRDTGRGDFYWDFSGKMITHKRNRSSFFMAGNVKDYPSSRLLEEHDCGQRVKVTVVSVPSAAGQAKYVGEILQHIASCQGEVARETAVVLPDSALLEPLLDSIPSCVESVNVTMGYPLSASALASFMESFCAMHLKSRIISGEIRFYGRYVKELLEHSYLNCLPGAKETVTSILSGNKVYVPCACLCEVSELFSAVFTPVVTMPESDSPEQVDNLCVCLVRMFRILGTMLPGIEREFIKSWMEVVLRMRDLNLSVRPVTFFKLMKGLVSGVSVPYRGEPLAGLQIMGPLETRALDFDNVIITSVNEGIFPSQSQSPSFIPYNLRKGFGLPTYEYQDAIWAYYFYRLLSRARAVWLLEDSRVEGVKGGGESRYIKQLEMLYGEHVDFSRVFVSFEMSRSQLEETPPVEKDARMMDLIRDIFITRQYPFSASSINEYIDCGLKFYFDKIVSLPVQEELAESLDYGTFGTVFHSVMESVYKPFEGMEVTAADIEGILSDTCALSSLVEERMMEELHSDVLRGQNIINKEIILAMARKTLERDVDFAPFVMVALEKKIPAPLTLDDGTQVKLYGIIDRMDRRMGVTRIIDYKTGKVELNYSDVSDIFDSGKSDRPGIILQLFVYQYLVRAEGFNGNAANVIYSLKSIFSSAPQEFAFEEHDYQKILSLLKETVSEILNPQVPFVKGRNARCEYCDFRLICKNR